MLKIKAALLIILLNFAGLSFAQDVLTLEQTRELALANSKSLAKYNLAVRSGVLDEKSQKYTMLPSPSLGASASATLWNADKTRQLNIQDTISAGLSFSISQKIYDGGKTAVQKAINALTTESSRQDALAEYYSILDSADSAYYSVLEAQAALEAAETSLKTAALSLSIAEVRMETNMISSGDYLQALADKAGKETSRNQAQRDLSLSKTKLKSLTGLAAIPGLEGVNFDTLEEIIQTCAGLDEGGLDTLYASLWDTLGTQNPALAKAYLANRRAEKNVNLAKRDYVPTLSASFSTGLNYSVASGLEPTTGRVSISGSIPLDFWVTANKVEKQKLALDQSALDYQTTISNLDIEIQTAMLDLVSQAQTLLSSRKASEYAEKHFEYVMELYRLSRNSQSELSDAEVLLRNNQNQLIRSQYGFLQALSKIRSLGTFESEDTIFNMLHAAGKSNTGVIE
jgi:outer membrane protein TolC